MSLILVNLLAIAAVGYESGVLGVLFHNNDTRYDHPGVPYSVFVEPMAASSLGGYYNKFIRGKYK